MSGSEASRLFEPHQPNPTDRKAAPLDLEIRPAELRDIEALGRLLAERESVDSEDARSRFRREITESEGSDQHLLLVAVVDGGETAAFARAARFERPRDDVSANSAPTGYYLGGVVVGREHRRRGIGRALTLARLDWIAARADHAFYFVNALNRASIDLHTEFGFVEITRDFSHPHATFVGGEGVLYRVELNPRARSGDSTRRSPI